MKEKEVRAYNATQVAIDDYYRILDNIERERSKMSMVNPQIQEEIDDYNDEYFKQIEWSGNEESSQNPTNSETFRTPETTTLDSLTFPDTKPSEEEQEKK